MYPGFSEEAIHICTVMYLDIKTFWQKVHSILTRVCRGSAVLNANQITEKPVIWSLLKATLTLTLTSGYYLTLPGMAYIRENHKAITPSTINITILITWGIACNYTWCHIHTPSQLRLFHAQFAVSIGARTTKHVSEQNKPSMSTTSSPACFDSRTLGLSCHVHSRFSLWLWLKLYSSYILILLSTVLSSSKSVCLYHKSAATSLL